MHVANIGDQPIATNLDIKGLNNIKKVKSITLSAGLKDRNTPEEPEKIIPQEKNMKNTSNQVYEIAPYSYTIFVYSSK